MDGTRTNGASQIYLDENLEGFSNVALGLSLRALGHGLKVAYVDCNSKATKLTNFFENLSLSYNFVNKFSKFQMDIFIFKDNGRISRTLIPAVEFFTITKDMFWNYVNNYDLIIFDNCDSNAITKFKVVNLLENKGENSEIVFVYNNSNDFSDVRANFDLITEYKYSQNKILSTNKNLLNITGNGKGKSTYGFGYLIRNFINKKDVKLIYFDKGGDFYGEVKFFAPLKKWSKEHNLYGSFDFVQTGMRRFDGKKFRFNNINEDLVEAREGLMLLKTALKNQAPVIAEELNTTIKTGLLELKDVLDVVKSSKNEMVITGRYSPKEILDLSSLVVEANEIKHYVSSGKGVRKGIDF